MGLFIPILMALNSIVLDIFHFVGATDRTALTFIRAMLVAWLKY